MKRLAIMVAVAGTFLMWSSLYSFAAPAVRLEIIDASILVGEAFDVDVIAEGVSDSDEVLAFGFDVLEPSGLTLNTATVGNGFDDDSGSYPETEVAGSAFPGIPGGNDILLATLNFTSSTIGTFTLAIDSDILDMNEGLTTFVLGQVDISAGTDVNVVPIPPAFLLFGSGIVGLVVSRKKVSKR